MTSPWFKLAAICSIVLGIVLFCVVFGGYSSLLRSQNRINGSRTLLTEACSNQYQLAERLLNEYRDNATPGFSGNLAQCAKKVRITLEQFAGQSTPISSDLIHDLEISHTALSAELIKFIDQLDKNADSQQQEKLQQMKKALFTTQDSIFVAKKRYNKEVTYFNQRKTVFPLFIIARIFGFIDLTYYPLSDDVFLSGEKTFATWAS